jgi:signal transduction histidine kinase
MVVITDITEKRKVADLNHLNEYKDIVLASVTHDLKTPLNSIICQSETALASFDLSSIKQNVKIIERNSKMLIHQVYDILDYSYYLKNKKIRVSKQYFTLSELIQDVRDIFIQQAQIKNLNFE